MSMTLSDDLAVEADLRRLLLSGGDVAPSGTVNYTHLNAYAWGVLQKSVPEALDAASLRLVERIVASAEPDENLDENPWLAARYLLTLGEVPKRLTDTVFDTRTGAHMSIGALILRMKMAKPDRLNYALKGHRQALAGSTSSKYIARTNWTANGAGIANAAAAVRVCIGDLAASGGISIELPSAEGAIELPTSSKDDIPSSGAVRGTSGVLGEEATAVPPEERRSEPHNFDDQSEFVGDVTIPDGTYLPRSTSFTKTWEIRNTGSTPWIGRRLVRVTPHGHTFPSSPDFVDIEDTMPGQSVRISIEMRTSDIEGATEVRFKMADDRGVLSFGERYTYGLGVTVVTKGKS